MPQFLHIEEDDLFLVPDAIVSVEAYEGKECEVYLTSGDSHVLTISAVDLVQRIERMAKTNG